jgi:hypothetical protein
MPRALLYPAGTVVAWAVELANADDRGTFFELKLQAISFPTKKISNVLSNWVRSAQQDKVANRRPYRSSPTSLVV